MKVIIKDIMNENRGNDLIDRVVKFLIDGTTYTVFSNYLGSKKDFVDVYIPFFPHAPYEIDLDDSYDWFNRYNKKLYTVDGDALEYMDNYFGITNVDTIRNIVINYYDIMYKEVERLLMDIDNTPNNTINENINRTQRFINKVSEILEVPYFKNLELYDVPRELWNDIFSIVFNKEVKNRWFNKIFDNNNNKLIYEEDDGEWVKREYDSNGKEIYREDSDGYWEKKEYDSNGKRIYYEDSDGHWEKKEYDFNGKEIYYEDSDGYWVKREFDSDGKRIYYEDSNGEIIDRRNNINENINKTQKFINKVSEILEVPYFKNLELYVVPEELWNDILSIIYNKEVSKVYKSLHDNNNNELYFENPDGYWVKQEYDNNGNKIYRENSNGYWVKREFDSNGNKIYYESSDGYWEKQEFDSKGNKIYVEDSNGYWEKREFDSNGKRIYYEDSNGYWEKQEFDSNGNKIYYENSDGEILDKRTNNINENINRTQKFINKVSEILDPPYFKNLELYDVPEELWNDILSIIYNKEVKMDSNMDSNRIIDSNGKEIYREDSIGYWEKREYDSNNNELYYENSDGYWGKREYDSNNNELYYEDSIGYWEKREYDINNREIYYEDSDGYWEKQEFDSKGNKIYYEDSTGSWVKREYDSNNNELYYEDSNGKIIDRRN
jgi:hypothetical protein